MYVSDEQVRQAMLWLRISEPSMADEIRQTIEACMTDLYVAGVMHINPPDALVQQAIKLYCKAQFGYEAESERYEKAYERLKVTLCCSSKYREGGNTWTPQGG